MIGVDVAARVSPIQRYAIPSNDDLAQTGAEVERLGRRWVSHALDIRDFAARLVSGASIDVTGGDSAHNV